MHDENLLYIEDADKRRLYYRFTPAALISNFVPLVVILPDEEGSEAHHFEYKMWNVLTPLVEDQFLPDLLQELIEQLAEEYECEEHIYLYGRGRGGYSAILHGILCGANAVYANQPQIRLSGTDTKENDLRNLLNPTETFPIFYLCDSENSDEVADFVQACEEAGIKTDLDHCPKREDEEEAIKEILNFLERMVSQG